MQPGDVVYFCWYSFEKKAEYVMQGTVADNSLYDGTQWQGYVNVRFTPVGMSGEICHHFLPEKLVTDSANVPHDDCWLVFGRRPTTVRYDKASASDAWQQVQQFKQEHWDTEHGHLAVDALDTFYQMWHDAIAAKRGYQDETPKPLTVDNIIQAVAEAVPSLSAVDPSILPPEPQPRRKLTAKEKRSTGRIMYHDAIQTSIFD